MSAAAPKSWSEALHHYQQTKVIIPALPDTRVTRHLPLSHAAYKHVNNPITGEYRDTEYKEEQEQRDIQRREQQQQRQQRRAAAASGSSADRKNTQHHHNIITHAETHSASSSSAPSSTVTTTTTSTSTPSSTQEYNIINNHLNYSDSASRLAAQDAAVIQRLHSKATLKLSKERRDYNHINHTYNTYTDKQQQHREEIDTEKKTLARNEEYWKTHHYHPILAEFYHPDMEAKFKEERQKAEQGYGQQQLLKLPDRYKHSEGMTYNIINHQT